MRFSRRSTSSAPVTTLRTARIFRHFSASASSRHSAGTSGNCSRWTETAAGLRESQASSAVKGSIGASQVTRQSNSLRMTARLARRRRRRRRVAIERVLADIEVEGRQLDIRKIDERAGDALELEGVVAFAHKLVEFGEPMQHQPLEFRHVVEGDVFLPVVRERAEHPADGVAELAIGVDIGLDDRLAEALVFPIVGGHDPEAQDVGAGIPSSPPAAMTTLPFDFDIFSPFSSMVKPWVMTAL